MPKIIGGSEDAALVTLAGDGRLTAADLHDASLMYEVRFGTGWKVKLAADLATRHTSYHANGGV